MNIEKLNRACDEIFLIILLGLILTCFAGWLQEPIPIPEEQQPYVNATLIHLKGNIVYLPLDAPIIYEPNWTEEEIDAMYCAGFHECNHSYLEMNNFTDI